MSAKERILRLLESRVGECVSREEIQTVAKISEWARRVRELTESGYDIEATPTGYVLRTSARRATTTRSRVTLKQRYRILSQCKFTCRSCGRTAEDGVKLVIDHVIPVSWGGPTDDSNLQVLCEECNSGKKAWLSDFDSDAMKSIMTLKSARERLRQYFQLRKGQICTRSELQIVSGISEYARRIRELKEEGMRIELANASGDYRHY